MSETSRLQRTAQSGSSVRPSVFELVCEVREVLRDELDTCAPEGRVGGKHHPYRPCEGGAAGWARDGLGPRVDLRG